MRVFQTKMVKKKYAGEQGCVYAPLSILSLFILNHKGDVIKLWLM